MEIYKHLHPGEIIKDIFDRNNLSITEAAKMLGVVRLSVSKLVNGHVGISPEMAIRLSILFGNSIEFWVNLQANYDSWKAEKELKRISKQVTPINKLTTELKKVKTSSKIKAA